jgi:signal peptidase I
MLSRIMNFSAEELTLLRTVARIRQNKHFKSALVAVIVIALLAGVILALSTTYSLRVVESSSMSIPFNYSPPGRYTWDYVWLTLTHPFNRTLNVGDIIVVQRVDPQDLNTNYPESDIIVYQKPDTPADTPIVHRIVAVNNVDGTLYFQTKGDGNPSVGWPAVPSPSDYDSANGIYHTSPNGVSQDLVIGKVVTRIPYFGWITLLLRGTSWALPLIVAIILVLIVLEFILPVIRKNEKKEQPTQTEPQQPVDNPPQPSPIDDPTVAALASLPRLTPKTG